MTPEMIDPTNPVVVLCAEGMAAEGAPVAARRLFEQAWAARRDHLAALPPGGYREFVALGIRRLAERVGAAKRDPLGGNKGLPREDLRIRRH